MWATIIIIFSRISSTLRNTSLVLNAHDSLSLEDPRGSHNVSTGSCIHVMYLLVISFPCIYVLYLSVVSFPCIYLLYLFVVCFPRIYVLNVPVVRFQCMYVL